MAKELSNALGNPEPWVFMANPKSEANLFANRFENRLTVRVTRQTFFAARAEARRVLGTDEIRLLKGPFS